MKLPILAYHSIDNSKSLISTGIGAFKEQMHYLWEKQYRCISLIEYINKTIKEEPLHYKSFILTFDDGYKNNIDAALPILKSFGFTATIFVVTGLAGNKNIWIKDEKIPSLPLLSWDEMIKMKEAGFDIQPHSQTHPDLTDIDIASIREEIVNSIQEIEKNLGVKSDIFCYPYGRFNDRIIEVLKTTQLKGAVTTRIGWNDDSIDTFSMKRISSRWFRKYPKVFNLCLNRMGCNLVSKMIKIKKGFL